MMTRRTLSSGLAGGLAAMLTGCGAFGRPSYRFRMTVEVETPQGVRTGSSVYEVSGRRSVALTSEEAKGSVSIRGQALVVDLPGDPLFVTLKMSPAGGTLAGAATRALATEAVQGDFDTLMAAVSELGKTFGSARAEMPRGRWPLMVRFRDINDPTSVDRVDPLASGVKRIVLETTSDDVTSGIEKRLPWLSRLGGGYLHGGFSSRGAPLGLDGTAFSTELRR